MSLAQGGGDSHFFFIRRLGPISTAHPQKYQEFQTPQKSIEILATQKISPILDPDLQKRP